MSREQPITAPDDVVAESAAADSIRVPGFHPPRQARSRAALEKLLTAAEEALVDRGLDDLTIADVADRAGVSVGGVYRRFAGKEQLLDAVLDRLLLRLQDTVAESLRVAEPSLVGVIKAFIHALAADFARIETVMSILAPGQRSAEAQRLGLRFLATLQRLFLDAATPFGPEIARPARSTALTTMLRTIIAACLHRSAVIRWWPDGLTWSQWADEITAMAITYLITPDHDPRTEDPH